MRLGWVLPDVLMPFAMTRGLLAIVTAVTLLFPPHLSAVSLAWRWDAAWYLSIAKEGYAYRPGDFSNVVFFPLFPMIIRVGGAALGGDEDADWLVAGILVSNLALLVALCYLSALVRLDFDKPAAQRTVRYLLVFPTSLYLSGIYAGSLFLALAIAAFYYARCQRWWLAGGLGGAAALSRPYGVFLVVPLVFEYLAQRRATRQALGPDAIALRLIPAAFGGYLLYLAWHFGHPLVFLDAYTAWGMRPMSPWETLERFWSAPLVLHGTEHSLLDLAFTATFVLLAIITWRYLRPSCALYASVLLLVMVSMGTLQSVMRYGLTLFPAFMVLAHVGRHRWFDCAYVISAVSLSILLMVLFAMGHWVA